jgi:type II secretory pathway pseudopilin PulG
MRARTREVQIFNMSLIDILCGALGAFCFMMLVLLPYYKPANEDLRKQEANTQDLLNELEKLKNAAKDSALAQQLAEMIQKLQDQLRQLQGQLNQLAAQNQQLKTENQDLTAKNQKQATYLEMRHPFVAVATTSPVQPIDLYLQSDAFTEDGKRKAPPFDPAKPYHDSFFSGDRRIATPAGVTLWMTRDAPIGVHFKVYVKLAAQPAARAATSVSTAVYGDWGNLEPPPLLLSPTRFWTLAGAITVEADGKLTFKEATQAERDDEWKKLSKGEPPPAQPTTAVPVMPFSTSPAQAGGATASAEEQARRKQLVDEMDKARKKAQEQRQQSATPSTSP